MGGVPLAVRLINYITMSLQIRITFNTSVFVSVMNGGIYYASDFLSDFKPYEFSEFVKNIKNIFIFKTVRQSQSSII